MRDLFAIAGLFLIGCILIIAGTVILIEMVWP